LIRKTQKINDVDGTKRSLDAFREPVAGVNR
jgi:hypothetical protein